MRAITPVTKRAVLSALLTYSLLWCPLPTIAFVLLGPKVICGPNSLDVWAQAWVALTFIGGMTCLGLLHRGGICRRLWAHVAAPFGALVLSGTTLAIGYFVSGLLVDSPLPQQVAAAPPAKLRVASTSTFSCGM